MLADPSLVASSAAAGRDRRSRSREIGESTGDRSRSSRSSSSRVRDSREGCRCARSWSRGSCDWSRESRPRSTDRLRSRRRKRSRRDASRSPSARVRSRQSRSRSSGRYWDRRVCLRPWNDCSRARQLCSRSSGCREARRDRSRSHGSPYRPRDRLPLSSDRLRSRTRSWRPGWSRRDHAEAVAASRDRCNSGLMVEPAPAVAGSSIPRLTPSLPDRARLFLSLTVSLAQRDAAVGSV